MKRFFAWLLVFVLLFSFVACDTTKESSKDTTGTTDKTKNSQGSTTPSSTGTVNTGGSTRPSTRPSGVQSGTGVSVVFNANGGTIVSGGYTVSVIPGGNIKTSDLPRVERDGYVLIGWSYDKYGNSMWTESHTFSQTDMLYACWSTGTTDTSGWGGTTDTSGWGGTTDTSGWGDTTDTSGTTESTNGTIDSNEGNYVTITLNNPDGTIQYESVEIPYGTTLDGYDLPTITEPGYRFEGWSYTTSYYEPKFLNRGDVFYDDTALYAVWERVIIDPPPTIDTTVEWSGQTLNILATVWDDYGTPSAPWSQVELTVAPGAWNSDEGFGQEINAAVLEREEYIKDTYGVELNFVNVRGRVLAQTLAESVVSGNPSNRYHIAMPRNIETQTIVSSNTVYDLSDSRYIDFSRSYYNQASVEAYTAFGLTLFAAGDFSFMNMQDISVIFCNIDMLESFSDFSDLYQLVREGKWTMDQMISLASMVSKNDGDPAWTDDDTYGFGTYNMARFYQYSGIQQVTPLDGSLEITLMNDSRLNSLVTKLWEVTGSHWSRTVWNDSYSIVNAFKDGRLLFCDETLQRIEEFDRDIEDFKVGILPAPKLTEDQSAYCTPATYRSTVMCIPKSTDDREMSEYFFEVLSYTGQRYLKDAYYNTLKSQIDPSIADETMEILKNYVFTGICYDQGYMYGWEGLLTTTQDKIYQYAGYSDIRYQEEILADFEEAAHKVDEWNISWLDYTEE